MVAEALGEVADWAGEDFGVIIPLKLLAKRRKQNFFQKKPRF
jgi:hypothetical protein